jgi:hypothetical protein
MTQLSSENLLSTLPSFARVMLEAILVSDLAAQFSPASCPGTMAKQPTDIVYSLQRECLIECLVSKTTRVVVA